MYYPPENLAEYLDSSLVTPLSGVTGEVSPSPHGSQKRTNGGRRSRYFFDEVRYQKKSSYIRDVPEGGGSLGPVNRTNDSREEKGTAFIWQW